MPNKYAYQTRVILFATTVMLYSAIINTDTGIISQFTHQYGNDWAGPFLTALFFLGSGLGATRNSYINKYQYRYCIFVGSFGSFFYIVLGIIYIQLGFTTYTLIMILIASFLGGGIVSIFYNSIYNYLTALSISDNQQTRYFCIAIGIINCSNLIGNLLSVGLITNLDTFWYLVVLACCIIVVNCVFLLFKDINSNNNNKDGDDNQNKQNSIRIKQTYISDIQQGINYQQKQPQQKQSSLSQSLNGGNTNKDNISNKPIIPKQQQKQSQYKIGTIHSNISPYNYIILFGATGMIISYIYTGFSIIVYKTFQQQMDDKQVNQLTFIFLIFQGIGQIVGGIIAILYSYYTTIATTTTINSSSNKSKPEYIMRYIIASFILTIVIIYFSYVLQNKIIMGIGIFICGIVDCLSVSLMLTIASRWGKRGVSAYNLGQCMLVFVNNTYMGFVEVEIISIVGFVYCMVSIVCLNLYISKIQKQNKDQQQQQQQQQQQYSQIAQY